MVSGQSIPPQQKSSGGVPLTGCLYVIILAALACCAVKGCKVVGMKYEEQKLKHEMVMDSLNKVRNDTIQYRGR